MPVCHPIAICMPICVPIGQPVAVGMPIGQAIAICMHVVGGGTAGMKLGGLVGEWRHVQGRVVGKEAHWLEHEAGCFYWHDWEIFWPRNVSCPKHMPCDWLCDLAVLQQQVAGISASAAD